MLTAAAGLLMVSNIRFHSFKQIDLRGKVPFVVVVAVMLAFAVILTEPPLVLFVVFLGYTLSGPVFALRRRMRRRAQKTPA